VPRRPSTVDIVDRKLMGTCI